MGHMEPSSSFALSLKPNIAYRSLNFVALRKKQTTLPSLFAYAGIPYQVFGERSGALSLTSACSRFPIARSCGSIAASAARTALSPSSAAFSSLARALIAAFSSAVNPWLFCCLRFFAVLLIGLLSCVRRPVCIRSDPRGGRISGQERRQARRELLTMLV